MGPAGLSQFGSIPTSFTLAIAPTRRTSCSEWLYLKKVNTCVYEPPVFRVLVIWPRAPMYLPVPPNTARTTGWPALNSAAVGGIIAGAEGDYLILTTAKGEKQKRCALLCVWVDLRRALDQRF